MPFQRSQIHALLNHVELLNGYKFSLTWSLPISNIPNYRMMTTCVKFHTFRGHYILRLVCLLEMGISTIYDNKWAQFVKCHVTKPYEALQI